MENKANPNWERISQIIKHYDFESVSQFARHIGLNRGENLYQIKRGNNGISKELAEMISEKFPELSKAWVLTGEGTMMLGASADPKMKDVVGIPFYRNFPQNRPPSEPDKALYFSKEIVYDADFAARCNTDELLPLYKPDEVVFMRRCALDKPVVYGELYFIVTDYCRIFRKIRKAPQDGEIFLESLNQEKYDDMIISFEDIIELYLIV